MKDKWVCKKCNKTITKKLYKNQCCKCSGRYIHFRLTQDNDIKNLVPLCAKHHKIFENMSKPLFINENNLKITQYILRNILSERYYATKYILEKIKMEKLCKI